MAGSKSDIMEIHGRIYSKEIFLIDDSIRNNVAFGIEASLIDDNKVWESLRDANLHDFIESLPEGLNTKLGEKGVRLSGGTKAEGWYCKSFVQRSKLSCV